MIIRFILLSICIHLVIRRINFLTIQYYHLFFFWKSSGNEFIQAFHCTTTKYESASMTMRKKYMQSNQVEPTQKYTKPTCMGIHFNGPKKEILEFFIFIFIFFPSKQYSFPSFFSRNILFKFFLSKKIMIKNKAYI